MPISRYDQLTPDNIALLNVFDNAALAASRLQDLAGYDIADERFERLLPHLIEGLIETGDADRALGNFLQWIARVGNRSTYFSLLTSHPAALHALLTIFSVSQFFSDLLIKNPEHFEVVVNPAIRDASGGVLGLLAAARIRMAVAKTVNAKRDALRRFKSAEVLRIGARDILGIADTETVTREISDFAEACVRGAAEIAGLASGFAVIAMGKLGARELNYASDIDLIFVHDDQMPQVDAIQFAEEITSALSKPTDAGLLFRVDLRLRPEGRFGPISRSIASCRAYYESWAEPWERQALIKARYVAGDPKVSEAFTKIAEPFVYRKTADMSFVASVRQNKRMIERKALRDGDSATNVKEGFGGIRDVEFIVQLMQLVSGGANPSIRTGATMDALRKLEAAGMLTAQECGELGESYLFLRNVEHRLQIMDERPVRDLPLGDSNAMEKFARRLKYDNASAFFADFHKHTRRNHAYLERLFYADAPQASSQPHIPNIVADWINDPASETNQQNLAELLRSAGFSEPPQIVNLLSRSIHENSYGDIHPEERKEFVGFASKLVNAASKTADPDLAFKGLETLASKLPSPAALYRTLGESPELLERLAVLASDSAPTLWQTVVQHPELLDRLADQELLERQECLQKSSEMKATPRLVAAYVRRERLRIGALDLWGLAKPETVMGELSDAAGQALVAALGSSLQSEGGAKAPALIGLGKLGGRELSYGSDWDVLWIAPDDSSASEIAAMKHVAEAAMKFLSADLKAHGESVEVDSRLRPEGRFGTLVRTLSDYAQYFESSADAWERQVLMKARPIGGDIDVGRQFMDTARGIVYDHFPDETGLETIRHLKSRMEKERAKSTVDLKLAPGGLSDIEWTVQLMQWRHGKRWVKAQSPNTLAALLALRDAGVMRQDDWEILSATYLDLYTLRNRLWMQGIRGDSPKSQTDEMTERRKAVREIFERLFFGK